MYRKSPAILYRDWRILIMMMFFFSGASIAQQNPMKPPAFALIKYHQEKMRLLPNGGRPNTAELKPLVLNSILYSDSRKIAIINDQMLTNGEKVDGAKIININKDRVKLVRKGKIINLRLQNGESQMQVTRK